jgi:lysyl-tRNA synthetase class 2
MTQSDDFIGQRQRRLENLQKLREQGVNPYPANSKKEFSNTEITEKYEKFEGKNVTLAGRLMTLRNHGKIIFADIQDQSGTIQICIKKDDFPEKPEKPFLSWEQLKLIDTGDFVNVYGKIGKTEQGHVTLFVEKFKLLSKSLRPLPPHLNNKEEQFRRRYIDLTLNSERRALFMRKSKFWEVQRNFMKDHGFVEVETPVLEHVTGGADARPFVTHHIDLGQDFFLRISTELYQKRLIGGGFEKVFTLGPNFRNEGMSDEHYQEYYQLEWYWAYADYRDNMELVKELIKDISQKVYGKTKFTTRGYSFDLNDEWQIIDYQKIIKEKFNIDIFTSSEAEMKKILDENNINLEEGAVNRNRLVDNIWKIIRKTINGPAFLINHPKFISPLAKSTPDNAELTERFQVILAGTELGNGYSEINDPIDQLDRFLEQQKLRESGDEEAQMLDIDFVEMLEYGMPPVSGYGQSERLFWFLENATPRETIFFPQLKKGVDELTKKIYPDIYKTQPKKDVQKTQKKSSSTKAISKEVHEQAMEILKKYNPNQNLVKHCLCVEAAMRGLAEHFGEDESKWGLAGLLHDADWELNRETPENHTRDTIKWMKEAGINDQEVVDAILTHNHHYNGEREPSSKMEWALYTCDELTGLIVSSTLVTPEKKMSSLSHESLMKKFNSKSFSAAVDRNQIRLGEEKLGIPFDEFVDIVLDSMKKIAPQIGL